MSKTVKSKVLSMSKLVQIYLWEQKCTLHSPRSSAAFFLDKVRFRSVQDQQTVGDYARTCS